MFFIKGGFFKIELVISLKQCNFKPFKNNYMSKSIIQTNLAPAPIGPYNQAVKAGGFLFISGQIAINPETNTVEATTIEEEAEQVMKNLEAILTTAGITFNDVVKTTIFLSDMELFGTVNTIYGKFFTDATAPARETVAVKGLPKNVHVEISMIAVC
jgi:2-iminobutanoate/2-iminopropanoate deaminase